MVWLTLSFIFLILASTCNAIMDTSVHHYDSSIFTNYNMLWWDGDISWKNKYVDGDTEKGRIKWFFGINKPVQLTDAFHFFKMLMIIFICFSIVCGVFSSLEHEWYIFLLLFISYGITWNVVFSRFYDKILIN
jgi:hypothetical protein